MKEGWRMVKLGDVCEIFGRIGFRGYTTKDIVSSSDEGAISLSPANIQDGKMDYSKCTYISWFKYEESPEIMIFNGDILLVKTGSSYGKSALVEKLPHKATINPQSVVLKNFKINNKFLAYQLRTQRIKDEFDRFVSGTAIPTFSQAKLSEVLICYPPLEEQHRIVSILDATFEKIDKLKANAEENLKNAKALFQQVLAQELKPKEGWVEKKLGEVVVKNEVGLVKNTKEQDARYDYPYLKMGNITNSNYLDMSSMVNVNATKEEVERYSLYYGDFLFNTRNSKELVGKSCVYDKKEGVCLYNNNIIRFTFDQIINPFFINYMFGNKIIKEQLERIKKGTTNVWAIYYKDLKDIILSFPTISEQQRIVQTLDTLSEKCRRLETIAQQTIRECDALKQSILRQAFSGEL